MPQVLTGRETTEVTIEALAHGVKPDDVHRVITELYDRSLVESLQGILPDVTAFVINLEQALGVQDQVLYLVVQLVREPTTGDFTLQMHIGSYEDQVGATRYSRVKWTDIQQRRSQLWHRLVKLAPAVAHRHTS